MRSISGFLRVGVIGAVAVLGVVVSAAPVYAATPLVVSSKITGPNAVTIIYSEAVHTVLNDYSAFTGALSGASLSSMAGSGSNTITLTFSNITMSPAAIGGITIANTVTSMSDNSPLGGGQYSLSDGQAPLLSSFSMSSNLAGGTVARAGDTVTVSFVTDEQVNSASATIDGHTVSLSGSGTSYSASYTISSSDTQDVVPVTVSFTDPSGNQGSSSFMFGGGLGPRIVSITSDANSSGTLGAGSTINFVLTLASPSPNAYVTGSYDGVPLSWTTNNGGATYTATYTVQQTNPSTSVPLQISGVTIRDSSGNVSLSAFGSDIQKTINSQSFSISQTMAVVSLVPSGTSARFGFFSAQDGTITYGGSCSSPNMTASTGANYVALSVLPDGVYSNCTVTVTDAAGYQSNALSIPAFTVGGGGSLNQVTATQTTPASAPVPASYSYKFYDPLVVGSKGADVTALQHRLTDEGLYAGPITGTYGALTSSAVKKFQKLHSLSQLGTVGPGTRAALNSGL